MGLQVWNIVFYVFLGHLLAAVGFYLNHRFVMHGKFGRLPYLKKIKRLHALHHAHPYDEKRNNHLIIPLWGKLLMACLIAVLSSFNFWFAIGVLSFFLLYGYRHYRIHNGDNKSRFYYHHHYHHVYDASVNYSGIYPVVDNVFRTYISTNIKLKK
tara:strand:+ start:151 stop:615 length:465 start_codon:yes stop_codon:yes gene_type:complete